MQGAVYGYLSPDEITIELMNWYKDHHFFPNPDLEGLIGDLRFEGKHTVRIIAHQGVLEYGARRTYRDLPGPDFEIEYLNPCKSAVV